MRVRLTDLEVEFQAGRTDPVPALGPLTLETEPHEILSIVGSSGCGKSTLLRAIAGILKPAGGSIEVLDKAESGSILLVPQENNLFPWMSALDNAIYGLRRSGIPRSECVSRAIPLFERMGIGGRLDAWPRELSTGMKQRVAVIRAFLSRPGLLLMDEPFGALDAQTRESLQQQLLKLWQDSKTAVVFVTHDVEEAILLGQRVIVLAGSPGRIAATYPIPFGYPRDFETTLLPEFVDLKYRVHTSLGLHREAAARAR